MAKMGATCNGGRADIGAVSNSLTRLGFGPKHVHNSALGSARDNTEGYLSAEQFRAQPATQEVFSSTDTRPREHR
jgi:hypothetical protein